MSGYARKGGSALSEDLEHASAEGVPASGVSSSLSDSMIAGILAKAKPLGHNEDRKAGNLGFGHLYYGVVRALRPRHLLVIGSGYGFSVVCLALGLKDNGFGRLTFVDPAYDVMVNGPFKTIGGRGFWSDPDFVKKHFAGFGVGDIVTHHQMTSEEFFAGGAPKGLAPIDLAFIDGNHSFASVRHDFLAVLARSRRGSYVFLHDTNIYVRERIGHAGVKKWLKVIAREPRHFEVVDFPLSSGVALVRIKKSGLPSSWK